MQVLQAANTGITSLQKLVDSAKSIANQVLQSPSAIRTKSNVTAAAVPGATADNLLGTRHTPTTRSPAPSSTMTIRRRGADHGATKLVGTAGCGFRRSGTTITNGSVLTVDGKTITFSTAQTTSTTDSFGNVTIGIGAGSTLTVQSAT